SIWPGVVIRGDVNTITIGEESNVQDGSILHVSRPTPKQPNGAPLIIGKRVTIGHGVILHGCRIGDDTMIGMRATVMDNVVVGDKAMIAAGALVAPGKQVEAASLWMGSPAQFRRLLSEEEQLEHQATTANYVRLSREYLAEIS
ncbi:MAG: gamma carbonic anhydrase family protein, partial [Magnetococcales bacterium]|nr:gamma carbonic anhydrase family protein [Magnetococcales bacterium]